MFIKAFWTEGPNIDTLEFTDMGDTPVEIIHSKPKASNAVGTSQTLISTPKNRPFTMRLVPIGYALVLHMFLNGMLKRLSTIEKKVKTIDSRVMHHRFYMLLGL